MKPPFMMALALGLTLKGILFVQFRLINPLMKSKKSECEEETDFGQLIISLSNETENPL